MKNTAAIIPFYNGADHIKACVDSLLRDGLPESQIYLVDNSPDAIGLLCPDWPYRQLKIIRAKAAIGFGRACNVGAQIAISQDAKNLLFVNQDVVLAPGCLYALCSALESSADAALAGPINYTYDLLNIEPFFVKHFLAESPDLIRDALLKQLKSSYKVTKIIGACFAAKTACVRKLGLFDELYHMYSEDDDLCRRYNRAGYSILICPQARAGHYHNHIIKQHDSNLQMRIRRSEQVFELKDAARTFIANCLRVHRKNLLDYLELATKLRFDLAVKALAEDILLAFELPKVVRSRRRERGISRRNIESGSQLFRTASQCTGSRVKA